jgi:hypothetical protein
VIALVIVANATYAVPMPKMTLEDLADTEWRRREFDQWYTWLDTLWPAAEPPWSRDDFAALVRRTYWAERETVRMLRKPFKPFFDRIHAGQQWGLFAVVTENPDRLVIEVRRNKEWELLYRRLDGDHDWHDAQLRYRRIRGVWDGVKEEPKGTYKRLTTWIAKTIFAEQPDVDRVRVVLERHHEVLPWKEPRTEIKRRAERYHRRDEVMK